MRFRFFEPDDDRETARLLEIEHGARSLWADIASSPPGPESLLRQRRLLAAIEPGLAMEFDPQQGYILRPFEESSLRALADWLVQRAPPSVTAGSARRPTDLVQALGAVERDHGFDLRDARARVEFTRGHLFEVVVRARGLGSPLDDKRLDAANQLVAMLLGDDLVDHWIGAVEVAPALPANPLKLLQPERGGEGTWLPLAELERALRGALETVDTNLSALPCHRYCERADWSLLELSPRADTAVPAPDDCLVATTMLPEMFKCFLECNHFSSRRFSRNDETFVCIKYRTHGSLEENYAPRVELEEALNRALVPAEVGCVVANGLGVRHAYIALALAELEAGLEIARRTLRRVHAPRPAWILFCDEIWQREWLPVWEGQSAP